MSRLQIEIPQKGLAGDEIISHLKELRINDASWRDGRMFGYIYYPDEGHANAIEKANHLFLHETAINPLLCPSLRQLENETVAMVADLLHAGEGCAGNMTSGGSESILLALKTARDWARKNRPSVTEPELIAPLSIHPAFMKAANLTGVKLLLSPVTADQSADVAAMERLINRNTIMIAASAPDFAHGIMDPIEELADLAQQHDLLFHVDSCLGGLMLPFVEKLGYEVPPFDFRVSGVTSISADLHKYGYSPKGASVILYRSHELRKHQFFVVSNWPGGLYGTTTMLGTKPGAAIAAAWASLMTIGVDGYMKMAEAVMNTARKIQNGIKAIPGLDIIGKPVMSVFSFTSEKHDIYGIGNAMAKRGWILDKLKLPPALHTAVAYQNTGREDEFISALKESVTASMDDNNDVNNDDYEAAAYMMMASSDNLGHFDAMMLDALDRLYTF